MLVGLALCIVTSSIGDRGYDEEVLFRDLQEQTGIHLLHQIGDTGFIGILDGEDVGFALVEIEEGKYLLVREGPANETTTGKG